MTDWDCVGTCQLIKWCVVTDQTEAYAPDKFCSYMCVTHGKKIVLGTTMFVFLKSSETSSYLFVSLTFLCLPCSLGQDAFTLSDIFVHKTMRLPKTVLTLCDILTLWFWSLWAAVPLQCWLMSVLGSFQAWQCHISCCSRPLSVVTVAPCSAVQEDYWTGLKWWKRLAGKYSRFVLAYWYFPAELNSIMKQKYRW